MDGWRLIPYHKFSAFENMAIDEAIFRGNQLGESPPTLRFYGWDPPAISVGYFQDVEQEVDLDYCRKNRVDIVRRPTGGKAVFHDRELTYSFISREKEGPFTPGVLGTYLVISRCIIKGLSGLGLDAEVAQGGLPEERVPTAHCFSFPSRYEILIAGKKVCGSAQTRASGTFLQHGSLLLDFDAAKALRAIRDRDGCVTEDTLRKAVTYLGAYLREGRTDPAHLSGMLKAGFEDVLRVEFVEGRLTPEEEALKDKLLTGKYVNGQWNREGKIPEKDLIA